MAEAPFLEGMLRRGETPVKEIAECHELPFLGRHVSLLAGCVWPSWLLGRCRMRAGYYVRRVRHSIR